MTLSNEAKQNRDIAVKILRLTAARIETGELHVMDIDLPELSKPASVQDINFHIPDIELIADPENALEFLKDCNTIIQG